MTDTNMLKTLMSNSGYKRTFIAQKCGISYQALLNKVNNVTDFTCGEAIALGDLLGLDNKTMSMVFFCTDVGKKPHIGMDCDYHEE